MNRAKIWRTLVSVIMLVSIMIGEICLIPTNVYAATDELEKQGNSTNNRHVKFDAYLVNGDQQAHSVEISEENITSLNFNINVDEGYLTNIQVLVDNPNFVMQNVQDENVQKLENNTVSIKDVTTEKTISIPVTMDKKDSISLDYIDRETKVNLVATYIDNNGKERNIKKEITIKAKWNLHTTFSITSEISAFLASNDKTLLQEKITLRQNERKSPVEQTNLHITAPQINKMLPSEVRIYANKTKATNGDEFGSNFGANNYTYDQNSGNIEVKINNTTNENNEISFYDDADEYVVTYIYDAKINDLLKEKLQIATNVVADVKVYSTENTIQTNYSKQHEITKKIGSNISAEVYSPELINKGFLYDNYNETAYNLYYKLNISNKDANEKIDISTNNTIFKLGEDEGVTDKIYFKSIAVKEAMFKKVLGEEGYINIYDSDDNLIGTLNKDSEKNINGELEVSYKKNQRNIRIEISKTQVEGILELRNSKFIDSKLNYKMNVIKKFSAIKEGIKIDKNYEGEVKLNETYTKVDLQMDQTTLTPFVDNNVNFTLNLATNNNAYDLFKNPEIHIVFPEEIESISIGEISLLYNTELKLESANLKDNRELIIKLSGEETNYKLGIQDGTKILIPAVIKLKNTVSTKECNVQMTYTNELAQYTEYSAQNKDCINIPFNITAKSGLITVSSLSGYNKNDSQMSLDENTVTGQLEINSDAKTASVNTTIVNNYESEISNVRILGKVPFAGNTNANGGDLGSTFDANLKEALKTSGIDAKVYYSENNETDENSGNWKTEIENMSSVKSYKIVLNNNIEKADEFNFAYNINIPAQLSANQKTFTTYTVRYDLDGQSLETTQTLGVATPEVQNSINNDSNTVTSASNSSIDMKITAKVGDTDLVDNSEIFEYEVLNFKIDVTNNSTNIVENIEIEAPVPDGMIYVTVNKNPFLEQEGTTAGKYIGVYTEQPDTDKLTLKVNSLEVGETKSIEYNLRAKKIEDNFIQKIAKSEFNLKLNGEIQTTGSLTTIIKKGKLKVELAYIKRTFLNDKNQYTYGYFVYNMTDEELNDVESTIEVPNGLTASNPRVINDGLSDAVLNEDNTLTEINDNIVTFKVNKIEAGEVAELRFSADVTEMTAIETVFKFPGSTKVGDEIYRSNISNNTIQGADITIEKSSPTANQEVKSNDEITYTIKVTNNSKDINSKIYITDTFPKEVQPEIMEYNKFEEPYNTETNEFFDFSTNFDSNDYSTSTGLPNYNEEKNEVTITSMIPAGKTISINIVVTVKELEQNTTLTNIARAYGDYIPEKMSNEIIHYGIKEQDSENPNNPDDPENPNNQKGRYSISGSIWLDNNEDGIMDSSEELISGNEITVVNAETSEIAENAVGQDVKATSSGSGYTLSGLEPGRYIVVFRFDRNNYKITQYMKEGASNVITSKAIETTAIIDGNTEYVGMTDVIEITNSDINYINMGLIRTSTFDIGIDKVLSRIQTTQRNGKQKTYIYDNVKMGKLEIPGKNIEGTTANIEYTITISNNGETKGYIKSIIDELPDDLEFNRLLNDNWYEENGKLYNTKITELNAGESKQVKLILTKFLTQENLGISNNTALFVATNTNDAIDSNQSNNQSSARLIIGTSTGRTILNVFLLIILLGIIAGGIYIIRKSKIEGR